MKDQESATNEPTWEPAQSMADGLLRPLAATMGLLGVLLLWARTYEQSCVALASSALVYVAVFWGLLQYRLERRRFAIDYYLDGASPWRRRLRRPWLPAAISMVAAFPFAVILAGFAALAGAADWLFLAGAAVLAPFLFKGVSVWPGRHFRGAIDRGIFAAPAGTLTSRVAGHVLLALVIIAFVYFNYSTIPAPAIINPGFPELSVEAFAAPVRSDCAVVETGLRAAAVVDGAGWLFMTVADSERWATEEIMMIFWAAFFLNAALAMTGFVRGLEGTMLVTARTTPGAGAGSARVSGAEPKRRTAGMRRATVLLVPSAVLTGVALHALQQQAVEQWSAELRSIDATEIRRVVEVSVDDAFDPAYAAIPAFVDQHVSFAGLWDQVTSAFGEDKSPFAEMHRMVGGLREAAAEGIDSKLREQDKVRLVRLFKRDLTAVPPWLRSAYEWVLEPVLGKARSRLAGTVGKSPIGVLSELQRRAETADYGTRIWSGLRWSVGSALGGDHYRELLRQWATAVLDEEKVLAKNQFSRALGIATAPDDSDS